MSLGKFKWKPYEILLHSHWDGHNHKPRNSKFWGEYGETRILRLCWYKWKEWFLLKIILGFLKKLKYRIFSFTTKYTSKRTENRCSKFVHKCSL